MTAEGNRAALNRAADCWNTGDLAGYLELYAPDALVHGYPGVESGLDSIRQFYEAFWAAFPASHLRFEDVLAEGSRLAIRFVVVGTHNGPFQGIPPTGKSVRLPGITIMAFDGGRCVERWSQVDFQGLLQQLGAIPGPTPASE